MPPPDAGAVDAAPCLREPCRLVAPQCGCAAGEACYFSGGAGCLPAGSLSVGSSCALNGDCAPGAGCVGGVGGSGSRRPYCDSPTNYHKHTGTLTALVQAMGTDLDAVGRPGAAFQQGPVRELLV